MGHRALVGKILKDGKVEVYYSHWGALNCYNAGDKKPEVPDEPDEKRWIVDNIQKFAEEEIDYLHHEAVWIDGEAYLPLWIFPASNIPVDKWITKGFGILIKVKNGKEFNYFCDIFYLERLCDWGLIGDLAELDIDKKILLIINEVVNWCSNNIPKFSPFGYKFFYVPRKELFEILKNDDEKGYKKYPHIKRELNKIRKILLIKNL